MHKKLIASSIAATAGLRRRHGAGRRARLGQGAEQEDHRVLPGRFADRMDHQGHRARRRQGPEEGRDLRRLSRRGSRRHGQEDGDRPEDRAQGRSRARPAAIPVTVQAANDGTNLYMRFSWKQPAGGGERMRQGERRQAGLHARGQQGRACQSLRLLGNLPPDARTMPDAKDDKKTKYVKDGSVASGKFYDLLQWTSKGSQGRRLCRRQARDGRRQGPGRSQGREEGRQMGRDLHPQAGRRRRGRHRDGVGQGLQLRLRHP